MKLGKVVTTALTVVGAVVIVDRVADTISTTHKRQISKCLNNLDKQLFDFDDCFKNDDCCKDTISTKKLNLRKNHLNKIFPDIKKYAQQNNEDVSFQYSIHVKPGESVKYSEVFDNDATNDNEENCCYTYFENNDTSETPLM
jgi:hypothetical protein